MSGVFMRFARGRTGSSGDHARYITRPRCSGGFWTRRRVGKIPLTGDRRMTDPFIHGTLANLWLARN